MNGYNSRRVDKTSGSEKRGANKLLAVPRATQNDEIATAAKACPERNEWERRFAMTNQ